jgi:hypothetical protein
MITFHCKLCDKRFHRRKGEEKRAKYCSRSCLGKDLIAGKTNNKRWYRVQDKLPEIGQIVLAWIISKKEPIIAIFEKDKFGPIWIQIIEKDYIHNPSEKQISHWMDIKPPIEFRNNRGKKSCWNF